MMIFPAKASSGLTLVSVENNFLSGRVMSGLTSIENDRLMMLRVFSERTVFLHPVIAAFLKVGANVIGGFEGCLVGLADDGGAGAGLLPFGVADLFKVLRCRVDDGAHERQRNLEPGEDGQVNQVSVHVVEGVVPEFVVPMAPV